MNKYNMCLRFDLSFNIYFELWIFSSGLNIIFANICWIEPSMEYPSIKLFNNNFGFELKIYINLMSTKYGFMKYILRSLVNNFGNELISFP